MRRLLALPLVAAVAAVAALTVAVALSPGADHGDGPAPSADPPADLSDLYVWHTPDHVYVVMTWDGRRTPVPDQTGTYDADVLYRLYVDNDGDDIRDVEMEIQFGQNPSGAWGVRIRGIPRAGEIVGPVEQLLTGHKARAFVGLRDDPFFYDVQGLSDTLATGSLQFDDTRDGFEGTNASAIVLELDRSSLDKGRELAFWATSSRPFP